MSRNHRPSPWDGAVSGTTAAILANVIVYPLDVYVSCNLILFPLVFLIIVIA